MALERGKLRLNMRIEMKLRINKMGFLLLRTRFQSLARCFAQKTMLIYISSPIWTNCPREILLWNLLKRLHLGCFWSYSNCILTTIGSDVYICVLTALIGSGVSVQREWKRKEERSLGKDTLIHNRNLFILFSLLGIPFKTQGYHQTIVSFL